MHVLGSVIVASANDNPFFSHSCVHRSFLVFVFRVSFPTAPAVDLHTLILFEQNCNRTLFVFSAFAERFREFPCFYRVCDFQINPKGGEIFFAKTPVDVALPSRRDYF